MRVRVSHRPLLTYFLNFNSDINPAFLYQLKKLKSMMVTQLSGSGSVVEHLLTKEKVAGSIPVSRSDLSGRRAVPNVVPLWASAYATHARHRSRRYRRMQSMLKTANSIVEWSKIPCLGLNWIEIERVERDGSLGVIASLRFPLSFTIFK